MRCLPMGSIGSTSLITITRQNSDFDEMRLGWAQTRGTAMLLRHAEQSLQELATGSDGHEL